VLSRRTWALRDTRRLSRNTMKERRDIPCTNACIFWGGRGAAMPLVFRTVEVLILHDTNYCKRSAVKHL
jgi:hypothetical protein